MGRGGENLGQNSPHLGDDTHFIRFEGWLAAGHASVFFPLPLPNVLLNFSK